MTSRRWVAAAFALLLAFPAVTHAKDFCFVSTSPPNPAPPNNPDIVLVVRGFTPPSKGKCKPFVGFELGTTNQAHARPATGVACLTSDKSRLRVSFTIHTAIFAGAPPTVADFARVGMDLPFPALSGGLVYFQNDSDTAVREDGIAAPCAFSIPLP
jgi:hypothetical protein